MKLHGKELLRAKPVIVVFPRMDDAGEHADMVFQCAPVIDYKPFEDLCPLPKPRMVTFPGNKNKPPQPQLNDPKYKEALTKYAEQKSAWLFVTSLKATPGLEWEIVNYGDPETWVKWQEELTDSGLTDVECQRLLFGIMEANSLSEDRMDEARDRFLAGQQAQQDE